MPTQQNSWANIWRDKYFNLNETRNVNRELLCAAALHIFLNTKVYFKKKKNQREQNLKGTLALNI